MYVKRDKQFEDGIPYVCGCKLTRCRCLWAEKGDFYPQRIYYGADYDYVRVLNSICKQISEGQINDEIKKLYNEHEYMTIDVNPYLFYCRSCGYWVNEESLSGDIYLDPETGLEKPYSRKEYKSLVEKNIYKHKRECPSCKKELEAIEPAKTGDVFEDWRAFEKMVYQLQLTCPKCQKKIVMLDNSGRSLKYRLYSPLKDTVSPEEIKRPDEWQAMFFSEEKSAE